MSATALPLAGCNADQRAVLELLAAGATITAAASQLGLHRTTIHHWRRTNPVFRQATDNARAAYRAGIQTAYEELAPKALETVKAILDDPKASLRVRLRAAQAILNQIHKPMIEIPAAPVHRPAPVATPAPAVEPTDAEIHHELTQMQQRWGMTARSK